MGWLIAGLVIGGLIKGAGALIESKAARVQAAEDASHREDLADLETKKLKYATDTALGNLEHNLAIDKENAFIKAETIREDTQAGFTGAMEQSYLGQLGAERQYMDATEKTQQQLGQLQVAQGMSGAKQNSDMTRIIEANATGELADMRKQIDSSRDITVYNAKQTADQNMEGAQRLEDQFTAGSTYMNYYDYQRGRIEGAAALDQLSLDMQKTWATEDYEAATNYWGSSWMWGDIFAVAGAGVDTFTSIYGTGAFNKTSKSYGSPSGGGGNWTL